MAKRKKLPKRTKLPPNLADEVIDVQFSKEELLSLANIMSISAQTFGYLAKEALKENNEKAYDILSNRQKVTSSYATKLSSIYNMGHTLSRELH